MSGRWRGWEPAACCVGACDRRARPARLGKLGPDSAAVRVASWAFVVGIVSLCGTLYLLTLTGMTWLGALTPLGGVALLAGWEWSRWGGSDSEPVLPGHIQRNGLEEAWS